MAKWMNLAGIAVGVTGVAVGLYFVGHDMPRIAIFLVAITSVGLSGILGFVRHVFFQRSDARYAGLESSQPDWSYEVGFANLAFGLSALAAVFCGWGAYAAAATIFAYGVFLGQSALLHLIRYAIQQPHQRELLWRTVIATGVFAAWMLFFAVHAFTAVAAS